MTNERDPVVPLAIGGVGGSGTRVVANIVRELGYHLGDDLNGANDNMWFTLLFKRRETLELGDGEFARLVRIFTAAMSGTELSGADTEALITGLAAERRHRQDAGWLEGHATSLLRQLRLRARHARWGWKEPNTHVLIPRMGEHLPDLHYIHVIRSGLDMAFSSNKTQLLYWADLLFDMNPLEPADPGNLLRYWRLVNERISGFRTSGAFPILEVGFEALCEHPVDVISTIAEFCRCDVSTETASAMARDLVRAPDSIARHREHDLSVLDPADRAYAKSVAERLAHPRSSTGLG